jgi:hypothetical protein
MGGTASHGLMEPGATEAEGELPQRGSAWPRECRRTMVEEGDVQVACQGW